MQCFFATTRGLQARTSFGGIGRHVQTERPRDDLGVFGSITRRSRPSEAKTVCRTMQDGYKPLTLLNSAC